jgi:RND family efflux transporter MFP subunit
MKRMLIFLLFPALWASCADHNGKATETSATVKTITIGVDSYRSNNNYLATIEPELEAGLSFQVSGNVESVLVSEGQLVKKGMLLARLSAGHLNNVYSSAKAEYDQAKDAYSRMERLYKSNSLPEAKYIEVQSKWHQAKAQLESARKDITDCSLYAPFDGVVDKKMIEIGINVSQGIPVLNLIKIGSVKAKMSISEKDISQIKLGQRVEIEIPVLNKSYPGKITEKNLASNSISQTYDVKVKLLNPANELLSGMVGNARVYGDFSKSYITVPPAAIQLLPNDERYVWLVDSRHKVRQVQITTVSQTIDGIQVSSGLRQGDKVVVEGFQKLSAGMTVKEL